MTSLLVPSEPSVKSTVEERSMPTSRAFETKVQIPSAEEFGAKYPQYGSRPMGGGREFFRLIMQPASFLKAAFATDELDLPAVAGVAKLCAEASYGRLAAADKQYIGALVCALMEANGYKKTGKKKAIPHKAFTKGEVYECRGAAKK